MNKYLDNICQELYKYVRGIGNSYGIMLPQIALKLGFFCECRGLDEKKGKEILNNISEYMKRNSGQYLEIEHIRSDIERIIDERSEDEKFFYENLRPYGEILNRHEFDNVKNGRRTYTTEIMWSLDDEMYFTLQMDGELKILRKVKSK